MLLNYQHQMLINLFINSGFFYYLCKQIAVKHYEKILQKGVDWSTGSYDIHCGGLQFQ